MRRLRWVYGLFAALLAAMLAYTAFWFTLKGQIERGIVEWAAERRALGWQVDYKLTPVSGFPYRLVIDLAEVAVADPTHAQAWALRLPAVKVVTQPWTPRHLILLASGRGSLAWGPATARSELRAAGQDLRASLVLGPRDRPLRLAIESQKSSLDLAFPRFDGRFLAWADRAELHFRDNRDGRGDPAETAVDLAVSTVNLTTSVISPGAPFGPTIALLSADLGLTGPIDAPSVARWRDDGGTLELRRAALRWGPFDATANGTMALDAQMRPIGAMTAEARGWEAVLDKLAENRHMARGQARALKLALGLLSKPGPDGAKVLTAPLAAQDGKLLVGPVAVMDLPPLPLE